MRRAHLGTALSLGVTLTLSGAGALAQQSVDQGGATTGSAPPPTAGPAPAAPSPTPGGGAPTYSSVPVFPGAVAPPPPGVPLGGGNATESSSHTYQGDKEDTFDLGPRSGGGGSSYGGQSGPIYLGHASQSSVTLGGGQVPYVHQVKKGDTLWGICDSYFSNPYQWPRVWSYNPQLQNPHWIYPGDQLRLRSGIELPAQPAEAANASNSGSLVGRSKALVPDSVYLRDTGYVDDEKVVNWGDITGAPEDKIFLTDFDEIYLRILPEHDNVQLGQQLTIYRPTRSVGKGTIVQIQGTVRIDQVDPKHHLARGQIVESLDVIERGARIGPVDRRFEVVAPVRNDSDVKAEIMASVYPHNFFGQNQVVFLNKGANDGLKAGNRLFIVRRGDAWRQSLATNGAAQRIKLESNSPAELETMPRPRDEGRFPEERVGELRVLAVRPTSATALVSQSSREIELGDVAVARKGY